MKNNKILKTLVSVLVIFLVIILVWIFINKKEQNNSNIVEDVNINQNNNVNNEDVNEDISEDMNEDNVENEDNIENEINYENDEGLSLENPEKNELVTSPISVRGEATGPWYFEANFGVKLVNRENGKIIDQSYAMALGDWMSEGKVEFDASLNFSVDEETEALLILESANPSGLEENQMTYTVPVILSASN
ncbi:Gmad2 immunoglobulin-like domain-containing protein [Patescibacteria group bacterium]|nr:Gmad2 immunoglobulin-like domain-containing protein [Patescibacteria group bacterium]